MSTSQSSSDTTSSSEQYNTASGHGYSQTYINPNAEPMFGWATGLAENMMQTPTPYFPGQGYVAPSVPTQQSTDMLMNAAGQMEPMSQGLQQNYMGLSNAADVANNPYVQGMLGANADQINQQLMEKWLPAVQQGALGVNALGSGRQGLAQANAIQGAARELANANAGVLNNAYGAGLSAQQQALANTPAAFQAMTIPGQTAAGAGQQVEGYQQKALDDAMARYYWQYSEPWQRAQNVYGMMEQYSPYSMYGEEQQSGNASIGSGTSSSNTSSSGFDLGDIFTYAAGAGGGAS